MCNSLCATRYAQLAMRDSLCATVVHSSDIANLTGCTSGSVSTLPVLYWRKLRENKGFKLKAPSSFSQSNFETERFQAGVKLAPPTHLANALAHPRGQLHDLREGVPRRRVVVAHAQTNQVSKLKALLYPFHNQSLKAWCFQDRVKLAPPGRVRHHHLAEHHVAATPLRMVVQRHEEIRSQRTPRVVAQAQKSGSS